MGIIVGEVRFNGALAPGAKLYTNTGGCAIAPDGTYMMVVPPGICTVVAHYNGKAGSQSGVQVLPGDVTVVNIDIS